MINVNLPRGGVRHYQRGIVDIDYYFTNNTKYPQNGYDTYVQEATAYRSVWNPSYSGITYDQTGKKVPLSGFVNPNKMIILLFPVVDKNNPDTVPMPGGTVKVPVYELTKDFFRYMPYCDLPTANTWHVSAKFLYVVIEFY